MQSPKGKKVPTKRDAASPWDNGLTKALHIGRVGPAKLSSCGAERRSKGSSERRKSARAAQRCSPESNGKSTPQKEKGLPVFFISGVRRVKGGKAREKREKKSAECRGLLRRDRPSGLRRPLDSLALKKRGTPLSFLGG